MDSSLEFIFCPLFCSLMLAGQYHFTGRCGRWFSLSKLYCGIVLLSSCLNTVRHGFLYAGARDDFETHSLVLFHMWTLQKTWTVSYFVFFGCRRTKLFMRHWQDYRDAFPSCAPTDLFVKHLRKLLIMFWSGMALLLLSAIVIYLTVKVPYTVNYKPFSNSTDIHWSFVLFGAFINTTYVEVYFAPLIAIYTLCHAINTEFRTINQDLRQYITNDSITLEGIEQLRERHLMMCDVVHKFDDVWSPYLFVSMVLDVPMVAIHALVIISSFEPATMQRYIARWYGLLLSAAMSLVHVMVLVWSAASISKQAQAPAKYLFTIDLRKVDLAATAAIQMFHLRLKEHIGLSLWRMVEITYGMIITVFTIILSYLLVMVEFGLDVKSVVATKDNSTQ